MQKQVAFFFGSADFTGGPKMGWHIAKAFVRAGYQVVAIVGECPAKDASVVEHLEKDGIIVIRETGFSSLWSMSLVRRCTRHLGAFRPQLLVSVVQSDLKIAAPVARLLGVPLVVMGQSLTTFYGPAPIRVLKRWMYGRLVRRARLVVGVSKVVAEHYRQAHRIRDESLAVIAPGIETDQFKPRFPSAIPDQKKVRFLNVGRLDVQKGQDILLDALASLPPYVRSDIQLQLVGGETLGSPPSQQYSTRLRQKSETPELRNLIEFCGWRNDVPELLQQSDVYVHSARWEGLGLAVVEAMAVSLPVIYTDCAGRFEGFVDGVHGYMAKAGDAGSLASAMMRVLKLTADERAEMGRQARQLACEHYDVTALGDKFVNCCLGLIK